VEKENYIVLLNGISVRVEITMDALGEFIQKTGKELVHLNADLGKDVRSLRTLMHCTIKAGELLDGRAMDLTEESLGRLIGPKQIKDFFQIITWQSSTTTQKKKGVLMFPKAMSN